MKHPRWTWTDLGVAYSLATLWFMVSWKELLYPGSNNYYAWDLRPNLQHLVIIADVLLMTGLFFVLGLAARNSTSRPARLIWGVLFVVLGVLAFSPLSFELEKLFPTELQGFRSALLPTIVVVACGVPLIRKGLSLDLFRNNLRVVSLLLMPFCILVLLKSFATQAWGSADALQPLSITSSQPERQNRSSQSLKVVWIIFDELGYLPLSLVDRAGAHTPEVDKLMRESFVAHNAHPPADMTNESIPALLTGTQFKLVAPTSPSDAMLIPSDKSAPYSFRNSENIFKDARALGLRSGIVGWYVPYSRVFEGQVEECYWYPIIDRRCSEYSLLTKCGKAVLARSLRTIPVAGNKLPKDLYEAGSGIVREAPDTQVERLKFLTDKAYMLLSDRDLDFLYFHLSVPHKPFITRAGVDSSATYFTSLEVLDDIVGEIRRRLEQTEEWDNTILIISADHGFRWADPEDYPFLPDAERDAAIADERIPFIVRFPNDLSRLDYDKQFNTVHSRQIVREIFESRIQTPRDLSLWLDRNTGAQIVAGH